MKSMTKSRKQRLRACETVLAEHMEEFVGVGLALKEIRDDRLYKEAGHETFEDYCRKKWEFSGDYANKIIGSASLRLKLPSPGSKTKDKLSSSWTEGSVRELKRLGSESKAKAVAERVLEIEENIRRKNLTPYETSRERLEVLGEVKRKAIQRAKAASEKDGKCPNLGQKGRRKAGSERDLEDETGISKGEQRRAKRHVELCDAFPFMTSWKQDQVLKVGALAEKLPKSEWPRICSRSGRCGETFHARRRRRRRRRRRNHDKGTERQRRSSRPGPAA